MLDHYLFPESTWDDELRTLSAGELRRLLLLVMVNSGASTLLLDEPTNYLDFDSLDVVDEALREYPGTVVMVTHDAVFADRIRYPTATRLASTAALTSGPASPPGRLAARR